MATRYLFIETRDPHEFTGTAQTAELATQLGQAGHDVTIYLVQNAVFGARAKAKALSFAAYSGSPKIKVLVDNYSLRERGIETGELKSGYGVSGMDQLVDLLSADGVRAIWS